MNIKIARLEIMKTFPTDAGLVVWHVELTNVFCARSVGGAGESRWMVPMVKGYQITSLSPERVYIILLSGKAKSWLECLGRILAW